MSIVNELFKDSPERLENFQNTYFEEFFKRSSVLQCLRQLKRTFAVAENKVPIEFRTSFVDSFGNTQHLLVIFSMNVDRTWVLRFDYISEDYYDYGKYERNGTREKGFKFKFSEITKNLQVQFVSYTNWFERREILQILEELFS